MDKNGKYELFTKILHNWMRREDETGDEVCRHYIIYLQLCNSKTSPTQFFGLFFWSKVYLFAWANFNQLHKSLSYIKSPASKNARASCISQYHVSPSTVIFTWILLSAVQLKWPSSVSAFCAFSASGPTFYAKILLFYLNGQPSN